MKNITFQSESEIESVVCVDCGFAGPLVCDLCHENTGTHLMEPCEAATDSRHEWHHIWGMCGDNY